ncbi:hypothetical protein KTO58_13685 [Chitinophaga pendula]|uniref:hypothetical protein n=1 Tax=Chitinophaga TaxID=79328 RepID=UPI000BAEC53F|nr:MULTISPECIES: hypothetical protein [Chitinophaga]ASZ12214.1 hypothetical protein CK934_15215 [Chitinophaga sp. MD30]UCJ04756.1 hypothetical protein KTO58_13685 [Chitinophaga pendula]
MEEQDILTLWRSFDQQLATQLSFNQRQAVDLTQLKVQSLLGSMRPVKLFALAVGILWVLLVDTFIVMVWPKASIYFLVSAIVQVLLTKLAIGIYIYQLALIQQVDISAPILATQDRLARLRASTLWVTRLLFLQLPVWTTFYLSAAMLQQASLVMLIVQAVVTLLFTGMALWLFFNIRYERRDRRWFRVLFSGEEWTPILKSMALLEEVTTYQEQKK